MNKCVVVVVVVVAVVIAICFPKMQSADCSRCDKFWSRSPESGEKFNKMRPANVSFV